jgi:hypothetical protein
MAAFFPHALRLPSSENSETPMHCLNFILFSRNYKGYASNSDQCQKKTRSPFIDSQSTRGINMTRRVMTTAFNSIFDQDSEVNPGNDAASSLDRPFQASHIRACTNCVRAKAKCSTSVDVGAKCERYHVRSNYYFLHQLLMIYR